MCVCLCVHSIILPLAVVFYTALIIEEQLSSELTGCVCMVGKNGFVPCLMHFGVFQCRLDMRQSLALRTEAYEEVPETVADAVP